MKKIYKNLNVLLIIGALAFLTGPAFAQDISIAPGATVTIAPGATVTGGALTNAGTLTIKSDATGTGSLIVTSATKSGTPVVNVERYLPSANWHIVSSPVGGDTLRNFGADPANKIVSKSGTWGATYGIATYSTANDGWDYIGNTDNTEFIDCVGYSIKRTETGVVTFKGDSIHAGDQSIGIVSTSFAWNAVGNPFTSAMWVKNESSGNDFLTVNGNNLDASYVGLYVWDQSLASGAGDYTIIAAGGSFPFPGEEGEFSTDKIAVGQGFIVRPKPGVIMNFNAAMQVHATATEAPFKSAEIPTPAVRLTVSSGDLVNRVVVSFDAESTKGLDPGYDVGKLKGNANIALYTQLVDGSSDVDFMYQSVPDINYELLTIPVGLDLANAGDVIFSLETTPGFPSDMNVYLEDKVLNTTTQLDSDGAIYSASVPSLKGYGRFNLHFTNSTTGIDTDKLNTSNFNVFTRNRLIFVNGPADNSTRFSIYGIDGKMWYQNRAEATNQNTIDASGFAAGVYLIKIDKTNGSETLKVVLTN